MNAIRTKHNLDFECAPWNPMGLRIAKDFNQFRIGTCEGLWCATETTYDILAVTNSIPGNGHFEDVLEWFESSCRRDGKSLRFLECWNKHFKMHLVRKRGFSLQGKENVIKKIK